MVDDLASVGEVVKGFPRDHADRLAESHEDPMFRVKAFKTKVPRMGGGVRGLERPVLVHMSCAEELETAALISTDTEWCCGATLVG